MENHSVNNIIFCGDILSAKCKGDNSESGELLRTAFSIV